MTNVKHDMAAAEVPLNQPEVSSYDTSYPDVAQSPAAMTSVTTKMSNYLMSHEVTESSTDVNPNSQELCTYSASYHILNQASSSSDTSGSYAASVSPHSYPYGQSEVPLPTPVSQLYGSIGSKTVPVEALSREAKQLYSQYDEQAPTYADYANNHPHYSTAYPTQTSSQDSYEHQVKNWYASQKAAPGDAYMPYQQSTVPGDIKPSPEDRYPACQKSGQPYSGYVTAQSQPSYSYYGWDNTNQASSPQYASTNTTAMYSAVQQTTSHSLLPITEIKSEVSTQQQQDQQQQKTQIPINIIPFIKEMDVERCQRRARKGT